MLIKMKKIRKFYVVTHSIIQVLGGLRQEDCKFEISLGRKGREGKEKKIL
jgi:hypothetical protein